MQRHGEPFWHILPASVGPDVSPEVTSFSALLLPCRLRLTQAGHRWGGGSWAISGPTCRTLLGPQALAAPALASGCQERLLPGIYPLG